VPRLTGLDASFLYMETSSMHMHVCLVAVLDPATMPGPYSFDDLRAHIGGRVPLIPPFSRVLSPVPMQVHHPEWIDDPDFDLARHVHRVDLSDADDDRSGDRSDLDRLGRLAGEIAGVPLDRDRPLWDLTVVEGLDDDRLGLVIKVHHSAMDGTAGIEILYALFDLEPDPPAPEPDESDRSHESGRPAAPGDDRPSDLQRVSRAAVDRLRTTAGVGSLVRRTGEAIGGVARSRSGSSGPSGGTPLSAPRTPFNGAIEPARSLAFARIPLEQVKQVKTAFGATVNDVILATCARTLRRYLLARDQLPDGPLLASCPVSVRTEDEAGQFGNRVSVMFTQLPTHLDDPAECLQAAGAGATAAKADQRLLGPSLLGDWAEVADPRSMTWLTDQLSRFSLADRLPPVHNVVISNVPGPNFPVYLAGARLEQAYPMGPVLEGAGLNITVLSYVDAVDIGFIASPNLVPDLASLADDVAPAFAELVDLI
jgi:diacylglycerol O-acyltransferase / wax synthase